MWIGLSATMGNPETLVDWLAGNCRERPRGVFSPPTGAVAPAGVKLDHVGSVENAAMVISRLPRGEKRLVLINSRAKAERLDQELRTVGVTAFVTHSSLSQEQRHQAEDAFPNRDASQRPGCPGGGGSPALCGPQSGSILKVLRKDLGRELRTGRRETLLKEPRQGTCRRRSFAQRLVDGHGNASTSQLT
ncbi:MAG TPA: hypothetical protein DDY91_14100, partial [Planctomycetaceae bacterium]|nr:hypothetical protein [Planctomycetaceae bacterium]